MIVLNDIEKSVLKGIFDKIDVGILKGCYDAKNGDEHFMYGVLTAMTFFAYLISEDFGDEFDDNFTKNMLDSEKDM
jgi:hypothetical protein